jgi:hypothetical protein
MLPIAVTVAAEVTAATLSGDLVLTVWFRMGCRQSAEAYAVQAIRVHRQCARVRYGGRMTKRKILIVAILLAGAVTLGGAARLRRSANGHSRFVPYSIVWQVTDYDSTGVVRSTFTETRVKSGDGRWHDMVSRLDGSGEESFAEPGRGVFKVGADKLHFLSDAVAEPNRATAKEYAKSTQYERTERVLGIKTVILRPSPNFEIYCAPDLDGDWVKSVLDMNGMTRVFEPVSITLGEPEPAKLEHRELPVSREFYERTRGPADK